MNASPLRIFVTTSHISTVYISLLARNTLQAGGKDILFVDIGTRRKEQVQLIGEASKIHSWLLFHSFATSVGHDHNFSPSSAKKRLRKLSNLPLLKLVYKLLRERHLRKLTAGYCNQIKNYIRNSGYDYDSVELFGMSQTYLNEPLKELFPGIAFNFLEHGIGDYMYAINEREFKNNMYVLFEQSFKRYLEKRKINSDWIKPIPGIAAFRTTAADLLKIHEPTVRLNQLPKITKPVVFVLLEAVDIYNVSILFWKEYLANICRQLNNPGQYHYILKAHPLQSHLSMKLSAEFFTEKGFDFLLLENDAYCGLSAEVMFEKWAHQTQHVFCLFSSGCFYLSQLYPDMGIQFWYSTDFMSKYLDNSPQQFKKHFEGLRPMIEEVFATKCTPY